MYSYGTSIINCCYSMLLSFAESILSKFDPKSERRLELVKICLNVRGLEVSPACMAGSSIHLTLGIWAGVTDLSLLSWHT